MADNREPNDGSLNDDEMESVFSEEERNEIRTYIDDVATRNRISPDEAAFRGRDARQGLLIPIIVNVAAVLGVVVGVLVLRFVFTEEERDVRSEALEFASIEGRLIRELRAESQQLILAKEAEIEAVRQQLEELEAEQATLDEEIEARLAEREAQLREELEAELAAERTRLIAEGLDNAEIDRLMTDFENERRAFYEQQLEEFRAELEAERLALQNQIDALRSEYLQRLEELESERVQIVEDFRRRESDLRVQLEQRTRVLEIARVEATANLEAAQRELAQLERERDAVDSVRNQIVGQIESIQQAIQANDDATALARIDALSAFLSDDRVIALEPIARRREMDLFLLRQLRALVESRLSAADNEERSITQELRLIGEIRRLSEQAAGAGTPEDAQRTFEVLLDTLPEVSRAHREVVEQVRERAVEEVRTSERETIEAGTASATTLAAAGDYEAALDTYVAALEALPALAPDTDRMVSDFLRLGYALTDYVIDGERSDDLDEIAARAVVDIEAERIALEQRIDAAVEAAVEARERELSLEIERGNDRIAELTERIDELNSELSGVDQAARAGAAERVANAERSAELALETQRLERQIATLTAERDELQEERDTLEIQRDQLVDERATLRARFTEYAQAQEDAIAAGDFVGLANARDEFFLSSELDTMLPGFIDLIDQYDRQIVAEQQTTGLSAFAVNEIVEELSANLTPQQRSLLLQDAIEGAREDGDETLGAFLGLLAQMIEAVEASAN